jgi:hypothetical protein
VRARTRPRSRSSHTCLVPTNMTRLWPGASLRDPVLAQPLTLSDRRCAAIRGRGMRLVGPHAPASCMPPGAGQCGWPMDPGGTGCSIWLPKRSA